MSMSFPIIEVSVFALFFVTLFAALKSSAHQTAVLLAASLFGMAIELFFVHTVGGYEYGAFSVMIFDAPLWVALGWGVIIYTSYFTALETSLPAISRPAAAALMATSIDFALDPIAGGFGWWHWTRANDFFGISYDNFVGWLLIVGSFTAFTALLTSWKGESAWGPFAALPLSVVAVAIAQFGLERAYVPFGEGPVFYVVYMAFLIVATMPSLLSVTWYRSVIPLYLHGLLGGMLLVSDLGETYPELYGVFALAGSFSLLWSLAEPETVCADIPAPAAPPFKEEDGR